MDDTLRPPLISERSASPFLPWRRYAFPLDWHTQFSLPAGAPLPLHLEVGFGDGRYTVRRALEQPQDYFVGMEISSASIQRAIYKVKKAELGNVRLLKTGAQFAVQQLFAPGSLSSITMNFPDPWPKERHEEHRLLRVPFFHLAASRLRPGGAIMLATDHPDYLEFSKAQGLESGLYTLKSAEPPPAVFETKYALKWKGQGKPLYYQVFEYTGAPAPDYPILERDITMPHSIMTGSLPDFSHFEKIILPYEGGHVILHEAARSLDSDETKRPRWLIRATIDEHDLRQQILVAVQERRDDELIVKLESFGDPIITRTVRGAIHAVTEWLLTLGLRVVTRSY